MRKNNFIYAAEKNLSRNYFYNAIDSKRNSLMLSLSGTNPSVLFNLRKSINKKEFR